MDRFISWFVRNGGHLNESVEVLADTEEHFYVRVRNGCTLSESQTIISCPHALTFSYASSTYLDSGVRATQFDRTMFNQDIALRLLLMEQYLLGEDSFWWPYISILPQPLHQRVASELLDKGLSETPPNKGFQTPLYFDEKDMLWLAGTNLGAGTEGRASGWIQEFEAVKGAIEFDDKNRQDLWSRFAAQCDLYIWAATIITSRSFSSSALRIPDLDSPVLIPGVDLLNHSPSAKVTWSWGESTCAVQTDDLLSSGDQIFNNYGFKGNEELLMGYGFCLESNQADSFNLTYSSELSQHIDAAKTRHNDSRDIEQKSTGLSTQLEVIPSSLQATDVDVQNSTQSKTEDPPVKDIKFVMLGNDDYRFSPGFLADCSLALLNGRERNQGMTCTPKDHKFSNTTLSRNKLHTLCSIIMILQAKREEIRKHDGDLPLTPRNKNQQYASIYRSSQLNILEGVLSCLSSTLQSISCLKYEDQPRVLHLKDILTSHPNSLRTHFREVVHAGVGSRDPEKVVKRRGVEFAFAIWLCGLRLLHQSGNLASTDPILDQWIGFLFARYDTTPLATEDTETWLARISTTSKAPEATNTAASYVKAVRAAAGKHPESLYRDEWAHDVAHLTWCLVVAREERVRCPTVTAEGGIMGEEDDEFVLVVDVDDAGGGRRQGAVGNVESVDG